MIIGWIITKSHSSGISEFLVDSPLRTENGVYESYYFSKKHSDATIFRKKPEILMHTLSANIDSNTLELVPVECYF
jgi:hypothetical protein